MNNNFLKVLTLYGINFLHITGRTPPAKRSEIVQQFKDDPTVQVLIFSSVGSVGLNLAMSSVIIFLVRPFFFS